VAKPEHSLIVEASLRRTPQRARQSASTSVGERSTLIRLQVACRAQGLSWLGSREGMALARERCAEPLRHPPKGRYRKPLQPIENSGVRWAGFVRQNHIVLMSPAPAAGNSKIIEPSSSLRNPPSVDQVPTDSAASRADHNPCLLLHKELFLRFPYHPFQKPAGNVGVQSMANLPIGRNESVCDVYSSCWPWQAQAAATVASTHQDTLNPWIQILVNTGFSKRTKATMSHFIVALPTAAPFANPYNNNTWTIDIGRCAGGDAPRIVMGRTS